MKKAAFTSDPHATLKWDLPVTPRTGCKPRHEMIVHSLHASLRDSTSRSSDDGQIPNVNAEVTVDISGVGQQTQDGSRETSTPGPTTSGKS